jgi:hypothetical protein
MRSWGEILRLGEMAPLLMDLHSDLARIELVKRYDY